MKIKQGFILHRIGDDYIIMQDGSSNVDFSKVISLNQTSAMLWQEIENTEFDTDSVTEALTSRYDVDNESARRDAQKFIDSLDREGIIEEGRICNTLSFHWYAPACGALRQTDNSSGRSRRTTGKPCTAWQTHKPCLH